MSYRQMADDILVLLAHLKLSFIYLSGHSMGGKVGMYLALNHPDVIKKLVVVDIAPIAYSLWHQQIFHALFSLPLNKITSRRDADSLLAEHIDNAFERAFLLKNLKRVDSGYEWKCDLLEIARNYLKIAGFPVQDGSFNGEVLFIKGEDSDYITDEAMPQILQYFPRATIKTISNSGHLPHVQQSEGFYEQVSGFLE
jgi:esterase